jgi:hypothetical protein
LRENIESKFPNALVVQFDPWLVSSRDDLLAEFFNELIGTINVSDKRNKKFKKLAAILTTYGTHIAPIGNLHTPGLGTIISALFNTFNKFFSRPQSLVTLRQKISAELEKISSPVIVLIDEIDRVEDDEIRCVAQLVRSVADFSGISYVLAYDHNRLIQAFGVDAPIDQREERGKSYLEKIVQFQIPLPVLFEDEICQLLTADIRGLADTLDLPIDFEHINRYKNLLELLANEVIHTLRDVRRLVGTFQILRSMLVDEVDWVDLLAYSALLTKAPETAERMRRTPGLYIGNPMSSRELRQYLDRSERSAEDRLSELIAPSENIAGTRELLKYIFPGLDGQSSGEVSYVDALCQRRPLLTTLRLGLLPGAFSRDDVKSIMSFPPVDVCRRLQEAENNDNLTQLVDRIDDLYAELATTNCVTFWQGVSEYTKKNDCEWMKSYQPMHEVIRSFTGILEQYARRERGLRHNASEIFDNLYSSGESELTAQWLRHHIHAFGLFGNEARGGEDWFLEPTKVETLATEIARNRYEEHLSGKLIPCHWNLDSVYIMLDTGTWDNACKDSLYSALADDRAIDGFTLMLFGANYAAGSSTIEKICGYDRYIERVKKRLDSTNQVALDESVQIALKKALQNW